MVTNEVLGRIVADVTVRATDAGFTRSRGGLAHGVWWAEMAGRGTNGTWYELRLHHRPATGTVQGGLLAYRPLSEGGRTTVLGEATYEHLPHGEEDLIASVTQWLDIVVRESEQVTKGR